MDEEEIEANYEEEKEKIMEDYISRKENKKNSNAEEELFNKRLKNAMNKYNERMEKEIKNKEGSMKRKKDMRELLSKINIFAKKG